MIMKGKRMICLAAVLSAVMAAGPAWALAPSGHVGSVLPTQVQPEETKPAAEPAATEPVVTEPAETEPVKTEPAKTEKHSLMPSGGIGSVVPTTAETLAPETLSPETKVPETEGTGTEIPGTSAVPEATAAPETSAVPETEALESGTPEEETVSAETLPVETEVPEQPVTETSYTADTAGESGKELSYRKAMEFMEAGDYDMAIAILEILGDYSDSMVQLAMAKNAKQQAVYDQAAGMMEAGQYESAREVFLSLGNYKDSALKAVTCRQLQEEQEAKAKLAQTEAPLFEDGIAGKVVSEETGLVVYRQEGEEWVIQSTTKAPVYKTLVIITDSLGRCYLRADTEKDTDIYLFEEVWKLLVSIRDRGEDLQWTVTESGFLVNRADSRNPGSRLETEFIVLTADQVLAIGPDAPN